MPEKNSLLKLIKRCVKGNRLSQKKLYSLYYGYAMNICLRYTRNREDAVEILNDSFLKVFTNLHLYNHNLPFKPWLRRIVINTNIDHFRKCEKMYPIIGYEDHLTHVKDEVKIEPDIDLLPVIQKLSIQYRTVFNLYVMDGYKHQEIAEMLGISENTSRSNLLRAKVKLKEYILALYAQNKMSFGYGRFLQTN